MTNAMHRWFGHIEKMPEARMEKQKYSAEVEHVGATGDNDGHFMTKEPIISMFFLFTTVEHDICHFPYISRENVSVPILF